MARRRSPEPCVDEEQHECWQNCETEAFALLRGPRRRLAPDPGPKDLRIAGPCAAGVPARGIKRQGDHRVGVRQPLGPLDKCVREYARELTQVRVGVGPAMCVHTRSIDAMVGLSDAGAQIRFKDERARRRLSRRRERSPVQWGPRTTALRRRRPGRRRTGSLYRQGRGQDQEHPTLDILANPGTSPPPGTRR